MIKTKLESVVQLFNYFGCLCGLTIFVVYMD